MHGYEHRWETRRGGGTVEGGRPAAGLPARTAADEAASSYYGVPPIHGSHWKWLIALYFYLGGISSASYVIAALAHVFGTNPDRRLIRIGRYLSIAALVPGSLLLILDLGRPERFYHMFRVVKFRSPMSLGTWGLSIFGGFATVSALIEAAEDGLLGRNRASRLLLRLPAHVISGIGVFPAFFVGGYTGVLLGATAVPLWAKNALLWGPMFLCSAVSTAASAISLLLVHRRETPSETLERLEQIERTAMLSELSLLALSAARLGTTGRPLRAGREGRLLRYGTVGAGMLLPLATQAVNRKRRTPWMTTFASLLALAGGLIFRYVVVVGGKKSADDPAATFELARKPR